MSPTTRARLAQIADRVRDLTDGRGTDAVIDAVGMEAHGAPIGELAQRFVGLLPDFVARPMIEKAGIDRLSALLRLLRDRAPGRHGLDQRRLWRRD